MRHLRLHCICAAVAGVALTAPLSAGNWPQFRGPGAAGLSDEAGLPVKWNASQNVKWRAVLPGPGHSSPVVWGDRIFVTAFQSSGSWRLFAPATGKLLVVAVDRANGKIVWQKEVPSRAVEGTHPTNSPASPTPVTDGKSVFVYFGSHGLMALDFNGKQLWDVPLGPFPNEWGSASSPILYGNHVILNCDTDGDDFLMAVDKVTGKVAWRTSRAGATRAWPTPMIWNAAGRDEIVVSGSRRVKSYDARTGKELWTVDGLTQWVTPTPVAGHGLLFVASNGPGGNVVMAIKPGGRGDITGTHVAWRYDRSAPYNSSPLLVGDYLYTVKNGGVMTCLNARTGALAWQQRLPAGGDYYASPVAGDGKIYVVSEDGVATVLAAGPRYKPLSANDLGERTMATPAISGRTIYMRTDAALYAIQQ